MARLTRCGERFCLDGKPFFLLGVNYWPRTTNIRMWRYFDEKTIDEELGKLRGIGIRTIRFFLLDMDLADDKGRLDREAVEKIKKFTRLLRKHGLYGFITFLVGHMSGKNWPIPWLVGTKLYSPRGIYRTGVFVENVLRVIGGDEHVPGYILGNELDNVEKPEGREEAYLLQRYFYHIVKSHRLDAIVSSGNLPDSYMQETPNITGFADYVGPHIYVYDTDPVRHGYTISGLLELYSLSGTLPLVLEEYGYSSHQYPEELRARYIENTLYTALAHGAAGAFIWCANDYTGEDDEPFQWKPFELGFGLYDEKGGPKKAVERVKRFAEALKRVEEIGLHVKYRRWTGAVIVVPFYLYGGGEFVYARRGLGFHGVAGMLAMSHALLNMNSIPASMIHEGGLDNIGIDKPIIIPSVYTMYSTTWRRLAELVSMGARIYVSIAKGIGGFINQHESPTHMWRRLFGVEPGDAPGTYRLFDGGNLVLEGGGDRIVFEDVPRFATYRVEPVEAEPVLRDSYGEPVLLAHRLGRGIVVLSTIPVEQLAYYSPRWRPGPLKKYYKIIMDLLDLKPPITKDDDAIEIQVYRGSGDSLVFLINHSTTCRETRLRGIKRIKEVIGGSGKLLSENTLMIEGKSTAIILVEHCTRP